MRILMFWGAFALLSAGVQAQNSKAAADAFMITRMVQKFHFKPKPLNDSFSVLVFNGFLLQADGGKQIFTSADITALKTFQYSLDDEIQNRTTGFLQLATALYSQRLKQSDSLATIICSQPFNFNLPEKITNTELESWPANLAEMKTKTYKLIKQDVLDYVMAGRDDIGLLSPAQLKNYVDSIEPVSRKKAASQFKRQITQMLEGPGGISQQVADLYCKSIAQAYDPHTEYFPVTEKENFEASLGNKKPVFGFSLEQNDKGEATIANLMPGSPAFKSGQINKGDKIVSLQWEGKAPIDVADASMRELSSMLEASNHDRLTFTIKKPDGTTRQVPLLKEDVEDQDDEKVKSFVLKGNKTIGYISLPAFYEDWEDTEVRRNGCANDVAKEIVKLKKENIDGLIIDVRFNGGGSVVEANELAGIFIDAGPVAQFKTTEEKVISLKDANRGTIYDGPLVVMVNGYSASASEMVAGTLQDYNRALIVGTPTYGKATAQAIFPMDTTINLEEDFSKKTAGSYVKITTAQLFRISGKTAQAQGVIPDVLLPDLLQVDGERESEQPNVILASTIEANKYYKPLAALPLQPLADAGNKAITGNNYFDRVKQYASFVATKKQSQETSLNLAAVIAAQKALEAKKVTAETTAQAAYTINNTALDNDRIKADSNMQDMTNYWKTFLAKDPYLQATYQVMLTMIK